MGGNVPLGYVVKDRKLLIDEAAARTVRHIYRRYLTLGSVWSLKEELERDGVVSKVRVDRYGRATGGNPLARSALYTMLQNRIYRGRIVHKDKHYPGAHAARTHRDLRRDAAPHRRRLQCGATINLRPLSPGTCAPTPTTRNYRPISQLR